jgi:hypothetical protein
MSNGLHLTPPMHLQLGRDAAKEPLVFLAGPIKGAPDWQATAARLIQAADPRIHVANPRRPIRVDGEFTDAMWDEQNDWEHRYLDYAKGYGVTLFWLANEDEHLCDRAYAQTTRVEIGMTIIRCGLLGARMVIGLDTAFSGEKYIRRTSRKYAPDALHCTSLEDTCAKAVELIHGMYPEMSPTSPMGG